MRDLVGFHFGCSDFARSHSMTDVEGGNLTDAKAAAWLWLYPKATIRSSRRMFVSIAAKMRLRSFAAGYRVMGHARKSDLSQMVFNAHFVVGRAP